MLQGFIYMNNGLLLIIMFFLHVLAEFNLQGMMEEMKRKDFWKKYDRKYQFDYTIVLIGHSFQWAFVLHLPIIIYCIVTKELETYCNFSIVANTFIHAIIDTSKENDKRLNLIQDQFCHILQIIATWAIFCNLK